MMECLIITGCTSGLGFELHQRLAQEHNENRCCIFLGRNLSRLKKQAQFKYLEVDFTQEYISASLLDLLPHNLAQLNIISNAGSIAPIAKVENLPIVDFSNSVAVNLTTPVAIISSLAQWTKQNQVNLRIVNITSGAANRAIAGWAAYCATKAGFKMFLDVLCDEQPTTDVIHFDPGVMDTDMQKKIREVSLESMPNVDVFVDYEKNNKLNNPQDIAIRLLQTLKNHS